MKTTLQKNILYTSLYIIVIVALTYAFVSNILYYYGVSWLIFSINNVSLALTAVNATLIVILLFNLKTSIKMQSILLLAILLWISTILSTALNANQYGDTMLYVLINQTVWIAVFVIAINSSKVKLINPSKVVLLTFPLIVFIYLLNIRSGNLVLVNAAGTASSIYYVLLFMPFVLDIKKNILKIGLILLIVLCVLISLKRTAFIASILAITFYFIIEYKIKNKTMPKKMYLLFVMVFIAIASYWMYNYTTTVFDLDIIARLSNLHHDGGSNRNIIYQEVWLAIKDTPFIERFFGHGFNGVYLTGITTTSAHNDFLEVLYDYGIVGFSLYIMFIISLINYNIKMYRHSYASTASFAASIVLFLVLSMTSHLIIYSTYFMYLLLYWGIKIQDYQGLARVHRVSLYNTSESKEVI